MQIKLVTISDKWQVVIPKWVRDKLKIKPKDKVLVFPLDSRRILVDVVGESVVKQACGALKKYDSDGEMFKRVLEEKRGDIEDEAKKRR